MSGDEGGVVELASIAHRYGKTVALDDVSLKLPSQGTAGLIGPDGVGKSTLLALIAGARRIQTGQVTVMGRDMADRNQRRACVNRIAYMPQGLGKNLYPTLSVAENLSFFGRLFGQGRVERDRRIDKLLRATGLSPFPDRPAGKLSGGMKQKLGLCCALIHDPDLLILDEPTTGVDPLSRRQFWELIDSLRQDRPQMRVLVATAYMEEAERFDWLAAMDAGKIIATGAPADLRRQANADNLEDAFIKLLPEEKRAGHQTVMVPPRAGDDRAPALVAKNLTKRFDGFTAVDSVNFEIQRGEIFGFLGSNGCGKTTTMKMLTGLLPPTEGEALLLGQPLDARDMQTRRRVGYMSQAFSLYAELTLRQNLTLHAHLFQVASGSISGRVAELLDRFDLVELAHAKPNSVPLGVRQRLQLAVAVLHKPEVLILDEPTSGVDPVARDKFWQLLIELSRNEGVTIFISTHFMNEAERCDRISLMHAGKVLAVGEPAEITHNRGADSLDEAFIGYLEDEIGDEAAKAADRDAPAIASAKNSHHVPVFSVRRLMAYAVRESMELVRDPIRMAFALIGPLILMITFGYGISFDVEDVSYAALDADRTTESRALIENFSSSRYFSQRPALSDVDEIDRRLQNGELKFAIEIPAGYGRSLLSGETPEIGVWLDGAMPFRAETARGYIQGVSDRYSTELAEQSVGPAPPADRLNIETRFRYNPAFKSAHAITPGAIMVLLMLIPAMMTAVGIVREKETGSIANFYVTPVTRVEFLIGKQLPYVAIAYLSFLSLVAMVILLFGVPIKGSVAALFIGAFIYVWATTGFGIVVSSFVRSQIAAIFATAIISMIPTINFSGFMTPVSSLKGGAQVMSAMFPTSHFQKISVGSFTKALDFPTLIGPQLAVGGFAVVFFILAALLLKKQER